MKIALPVLLIVLAFTTASAQESFVTKQALKRVADFDKAYAKLGQLDRQLQALRYRFQQAQAKRDKGLMDMLAPKYNAVLDEYKAQESALREKLQATVDQLDAALQADPKHVKLYVARARLAGFQGHGEVAIRLLGKALELSPASHALRLERGRYHFDLMHWRLALVDLEACIGADYRKDVCQQYKGQVLFYSQKFSAASQLFARLTTSKDKQVAKIATNFLKLTQGYVGYAVTEQQIIKQEAARDDLPRVRLVTEKGTLVIELFEDHAPNTVANFISLVSKKFYDGTTFHRLVPNFMIQGGDPNSKKPGASAAELGQGDPGYTIADELGPKSRKLFSGYLGMARRANKPNSGGSQFFLTHVPAGWLNDKHTVFGRVIKGMALVRMIARGDKIIKIEVLRKRDHKYQPKITPR